MARVLSTVVVLALLAATAVAFAITEGAKLDKSPIAATRVDPLFSPAGTDKRVAHIRFRLRTGERISVWIRDSHGHNVRTLLTNRSARRGARFDLVWDGFSPSGIVQADCTYDPVVKLGRSHRTIVLPSPIVLDTKPPVVTVKHPQYPLLSPDGDGRRDSFRIAYKLSEPAHAILFVDGKRVIFTRQQLQRSSLDWNGRIEGKAVPPGDYRVWLAAEDPAGNVSNGNVVHVAVRYVQLARNAIRAKAGTRFGVRVSADRRFRWRLGARSGTAAPGLMILRAPARPGRHQLVVTVLGHADAATVIVSPR